MAAKKKCKCYAQINDLLRERKAQLVGTIRLDGSVPKAIIATESNGETMRHKYQPVMLCANFCPFCGKKYPEPKAKTKSGARAKAGA